MMTCQELYQYKLTQGARAAADLLLLVGPDGFADDYDKWMSDLEQEASKS